MHCITLVSSWHRCDHCPFPEVATRRLPLDSSKRLLLQRWRDRCYCFHPASVVVAVGCTAVEDTSVAVDIAAGIVLAADTAAAEDNPAAADGTVPVVVVAVDNNLLAAAGLVAADPESVRQRVGKVVGFPLCVGSEREES